MNIIAGKQYVTACGLITPPLKKFGDFQDMFDVGFGNPLLWKKDGTYINSKDGNPMLNIVKEHAEAFLCTYLCGGGERHCMKIDDDCCISVSNATGDWLTYICVRGADISKWKDLFIQGDFRKELAEIKKEELDDWYERKTKTTGECDLHEHSEHHGTGTPVV